jgi:uncharacterized protein
MNYMTPKSTISDTPELPWYKQFWPWFLIALPSSVVIAGISTAIIAFSGADPLVHDNYYKKGLALNQSNEQVSIAKSRGIALNISIEKDLNGQEQLIMGLKLSGDFLEHSAENNDIKLRFSHPTIKNRDFTIELDKTSLQQVKLPSKVTGKWHLTLSNEPQTWLLRQSVFLQPDTEVVLK